MEENLKTKVYAYLDPRKPGKYEYRFKGGIYRPKFEPFYVGCARHLEPFRHLIGRKSSESVQLIIKRIREKSKEPIVKVLRSYFNREKALMLEEKLIKGIGRTDLKNGPLANKTDGGLGSKNLDRDICEKISKKNIEIWKDNEKKNKRTKKLKESLSDPRVREIFKKAAIKRWESEELREKHKKNLKKAMNAPEQRDAISKRMKARWASKAGREMMIKSMNKS